MIYKFGVSCKIRFVHFFQVRVLTCFFVLRDTNFNMREKIFVNIAWLPKATVQVSETCYLKIIIIITVTRCRQCFNYRLRLLCEKNCKKY